MGTQSATNDRATASGGSTGVQARGITNNSESPYVKLKSIGIADCQWEDGFWAKKYKLCQDVMVPHMGTLLKGDIGHAYNNFKIAAGLKEGDHKGEWWHDGDFYKWMEATIYIYTSNGDQDIIDELDEIIEVIGKAQDDDGYLSTHITIRGYERWSNRQYHELYNSGHLLTSASVHHRLTGKRNFLDIAIKHADYLYQLFQPRPPHLARFGFNPSQIMGLVELYRTTREARYLELAQVFVDMRGQETPIKQDPTVNPQFQGDMCQDRTPIREETEAVGHAVLAMYLYAGVADVYAETGEQALIDALDRIWNDVISKKMYLTGAVGQTHHGSSPNIDFVHEAFLNDYIMPNSTAYNETCANIANAMFNWRMLSLKGESRYADIMELVLFNSALSGISDDGKEYFYANPLRMNHNGRDYSKSATETAVRLPYIECFCCPPNLVRTIAKLSGWAYSLEENGVAVNLYGGNRLDTRMLDGSSIKIKQATQYPWEGTVRFTVEACKPELFKLMLRIPGWAQDSSILINGEPAGVEVRPGSYATIERTWQPGDVVELTMPMDVKLVEGHPRIEEVRNQVAVVRGPVVYCVETPDLPEGATILDVYLPLSSKLHAEHQPDLLGGITTIKGQVTLRSDRSDDMYRPLGSLDWQNIDTQFVPYFAWCNRGQSEMTVFVPVIWNA